jgi:hypothetical protein
MPTRLVGLVIDAADPSALAQFWANALGWEIASNQPDEVVVWPPGCDYPDPAVLPLSFVPVDEPKRVKNRVHLDLATTSAAHHQAEVSRLLDLGATMADVGQGAAAWVVLADPEGNELCVLEPRPEYSGIGPVAAVVVDCADPAAMLRFWGAASGWPERDSGAGLAALRSPAGGPYLEFVPAPDAKVVKNRMHLDVAPYPDDDHQAEVDRLRRAGAVPVDIGQGAVSWAVLADSEGNEFCVLSRR